MNRPYWFLLAALAIGLGFLGPRFSVRAQGRGEVVELGNLKSRVPAGWVRVKPDDPSDYRQFRLAPVRDDKQAARLTIYFLGKGSGNSAEKQVESWKAEFLPPEGKKLDDVAKVHKLTVGGASVTYLDVRGDYKGIPGDPATPREDFRLLGAYFVTPQGPYRVRLLGPADTVEFYAKEFENWLKAFK